ncbi:hypothetical protein BCR35DRAFT_332999 [Leucosporidium creatinivorum]|uniref:Cytochrome b561 domain-containing protein n=1 Tax=Leucosporidium creatinivorum TaxID=106004 RepID=A0A1Y2EWP9_9BASI|nr:hypothetical protein BCR35DRAFT_332999 [Leucosporidium creatinivorum]
MEDAAIAVLWPNEAENGWILSHRAAGGHAQPDYNPSASSSVGRFEIVTDASYSARSYTVVSYIRQLSLPSAQVLFPSSNSKYLNLTRKSGQRIIWAYSSERPSSDAESATLQMHDTRSFGYTSVNLSKPYLKVTAAASTDSSDSSSSDDGDGDGAGVDVEVEGTSSDASGGAGVVSSTWTHYDTIVFAHAGIALIIWLLVSPAAVLVGRLGRHRPSWFVWHSSIQGFLTLPATIIVVILGVVATRTDYGNRGVDSHKTLGFILLALVCLQSGGGILAHKAPLSTQPGSTRSGVRVAHILVGILILVLGWIQLGLGFREYQTRPRAKALSVLFPLCIALFAIVYLGSLLLLAAARHREGRPWSSSFVGLGRAAASPKRREWVGQMQDLSRSKRDSLDDLDGDRRGSLSMARRRESWSAPVAR